MPVPDLKAFEEGLTGTSTAVAPDLADFENSLSGQAPTKQTPATRAPVNTGTAEYPFPELTDKLKSLPQGHPNALPLNMWRMRAIQGDAVARMWALNPHNYANADTQPIGEPPEPTTLRNVGEDVPKTDTNVKLGWWDVPAARHAAGVPLAAAVEAPGYAAKGVAGLARLGMENAGPGLEMRPELRPMVENVSRYAAAMGALGDALTGSPAGEGIPAQVAKTAAQVTPGFIPGVGGPLLAGTFAGGAAEDVMEHGGTPQEAMKTAVPIALAAGVGSLSRGLASLAGGKATEAIAEPMLWGAQRLRAAASPVVGNPAAEFVARSALGAAEATEGGAGIMGVQGAQSPDPLKAWKESMPAMLGFGLMGAAGRVGRGPIPPTEQEAADYRKADEIIARLWRTNETPGQVPPSPDLGAPSENRPVSVEAPQAPTPVELPPAAAPVGPTSTTAQAQLARELTAMGQAEAPPQPLEGVANARQTGAPTRVPGRQEGVDREAQERLRLWNDAKNRVEAKPGEVPAQAQAPEGGGVPREAQRAVEPPISGLEERAGPPPAPEAGKGPALVPTLAPEGEKPPFVYHPRQDLSPEHRAIEGQFARELLDDPLGTLARYNALKDTKGGKVISADEVKRLSSAFLADGSLANAVHGPSSEFTDWLYRRKLAELPKGGDVALLAGGPGSGKSTVMDKEGLANDVGLIYDAIMANPKGARERIRQAHATGHNVIIDYVHCPVEKMVHQAIIRALDPKSNFRTVPLGYIIEKAFGSQATSLKIAQEAVPGSKTLSVRFFDNSAGIEDVHRISLEEMINKRYTSVEEVRKRAQQAYESDPARAQLSSAADAAFRDTAGAGVGGQPDRGTAGAPRPAVRGVPESGNRGGPEASNGPGPAQLGEEHAGPIPSDRGDMGLRPGVRGLPPNGVEPEGGRPTGEGGGTVPAGLGGGHRERGGEAGERRGAGPTGLPPEPTAGRPGGEAGAAEPRGGGNAPVPERPAAEQEPAVPGVEGAVRAGRGAPGPGEEAGAGESAEAGARVQDAASVEAQVASEPRAPSVTGWSFKSPQDALPPRGGIHRAKANLDAIKISKAALAEGRALTPDEQAILAKFSGWGSLKFIFDPKNQYEGGTKGELYDDAVGTLTREERQAAIVSTLNAHYTHPQIVADTWSMVGKMMGTALDKGRMRVLEPSCGMGVFIGLQPPEMRGRSAWSTVELDHMTGKMMGQLYPEAHNHVMGFEKLDVPDNTYDLAISNVPFGNSSPYDPRYKGKPLIHDYFFLKSIDKVRPGGLVAFITSTGTLDKPSAEVRQVIHGKADLVYGIRMPGGAHRESAGTEVVTDLLFFRKRLEGEAKGDAKWLGTTTVPDPAGGEPIPINRYFADHPENVLGTVDRTGTMYGKDEGKSPNVSLTPDFADRMKAAMDRAPADLMTPRIAPKRAEAPPLPAPGEMRNGALVVKDGHVYQKRGEELVQSGRDSDAPRVKWMRDVLDAMRACWAQERGGSTSAPERARLNKVYDAAVKKLGALNDPKNAKIMQADPDAPNLLSLEKKTDKGWEKGPAFSRPTVSPIRATKTSTNTHEASSVSMGSLGRVDPATVAKELGISQEEAEKRMVSEGSAYNDPTQGWTPAWRYLSGNVRAKLAEAKAAAEREPSMQPNVDALEKVQPPDKGPEDINPVLGASWIPKDVLDAFLRDEVRGANATMGPNGRYLVGMDTRGRYMESEAKWRVKSEKTGAVATSTDILNMALNGSAPDMSYHPEKGPRVPDPEADAKVADKANEMRRLFLEWSRRDSNREHQAALVKGYNDTMNVWHDAEIDHSWLGLEGLNPNLELDDHQRRSVARIITDGRALLAHEVGTGKTVTMVAAAMEMKRLGVARKPVIATLNNVVAQIGDAAARYFPGKNILVQPKEWGAKGTATSREAFLSRLANDEFDLAIISHQSLTSLRNSPEAESARIQEKLDELRAAHRAVEESGVAKTNKRAVAAMARQIQGLQNRQEELRDYKPAVNAITFEQTGIDHILVDEAHAFKNLQVITAKDRVLGISTKESKRAEDLMIKARILNGINGGQRGLTMATGTPITNTLPELFAMQSYLQHADLKAQGLQHFDSWARSFATEKSSPEVQANGDRKMVSRFVEWVNQEALSRLTGNVMDTVFTTDIPRVAEKLPKSTEVPIKIPQTDTQRQYRDWIAERIEAIKKNGKPEPGDDIVLAAWGDAKASAIDMRLVSPRATEADGSKVPAMAEEVARTYREGPKINGHDPVQFVFQDINSHPKPWGFDLNTAIVDKLVEKGIPRERIAVLKGGMTKTQNQAIKQAAKLGKYSVIIGGSETLGTGTNAQTYAYASHHVDVPHTPGAIVQRDGRLVRQGNLNPTVKLHRYVVEGTMDEAMWGRIAIKRNMINDILKRQAGGTVKEIETMDLDPERMAAEASGDTNLVRLLEVEDEHGRLKRAADSHEAQGRYLEDAAKSAETSAESYDRNIAGLREFSRSIEGKVPEKATLMVDEKPLTGEELTKHLEEIIKSRAYQGDMGDYAGQPVTFERAYGGELKVSWGDHVKFNAGTPLGITGNLKKAANTLPNEIKAQTDWATSQRVKAKDAREKLSGLGPFREQDALDKSTAELERLNGEIAKRPPRVSTLTPEKRAEFEQGVQLRRKAGEKIEEGKPKTPGEEESDITFGKNEPMDQEGEPLETLSHQGGGTVPADMPPRQQINTALYGPKETPVPTSHQAAGGLVKAWDWVPKIFAPQTRSGEAKVTAGLLREYGADLTHNKALAKEALHSASRFMGKMPEAEQDRFWDQMETRQRQDTPELQKVSDLLNEIQDKKYAEVRALADGELGYIHNYLPHLFKNPDEAAKIIADEYQRQASVAGPTGWMKKRSIPTMAQARALGLEPLSHNPVDAVLIHLRQMDKYVASQNLVQQLHAKGMLPYVSANDTLAGKTPAGMVPVNDRIFSVFGPRALTITEHVDKAVLDGLQKVLDNLGIKHERLAALGQGRLGLSVQGGKEVATRGGTELGILGHEVGHQIDQLYGLGRMLRGYGDELAKVADLHGETAEHFQTPAEQTASVVEAYVQARQRLQEVAPQSFKAMENLIAKNPDLQPLRDIKPSLDYQKLTYQQAHGGLLKMGEYYAPEPVARVLNNYLNPGLRDPSNAFSGIFNNYMTLANVVNRAQLGLSAFHLSFTSIDAASSKLALALQHLSDGHGTQFLRHLAEVPVAPITNAFLGNKLLREYYSPGSQGGEMAQVLNGLLAGGGRVELDDFHKVQCTKNMMAAFRSGNPLRMLVGGIGRIPFAAIEQTSRPIMEYIVPRQKLGCICDMVRRELANMPSDATPDYVRERMGKVIDSVDNRMGQLIYDNTFWPKYAKDIGMATTRALGWEIGKVRELGGGAIDFLQQINNLAHGRRVELTNRMAYSIAMPALSMAVGAITMYLMTGKGPDSLKDYFFPKTGEVDPQGRDIRLSLPTYMKDVFHVAHDPMGTITSKLHPLLAVMGQMLRNKDFFDQPIRNSDDPFMKQVIDAASYVGHQFMPIGIRQQEQGKAAGMSTGEQAAAFFGVTRAPKWASMSPAEQKADELMKAKYSGHGAPMDMSKLEARNDLLRRLRDPAQAAQAKSDLAEQVKSGMFTKQQAGNMVKSSTKTFLLDRVSRLGGTDAFHVYLQSDDAEKDAIRDLVISKVNRANIPAGQKADMLKRLGKP